MRASQRRSNTLTPKRRDPCILLLDDCFDSDKAATKIIEIGFSVERFTSFFPRDDCSGKRQQGVKDTRVITLCAERGFLLLTTDHEMKRTFIEELKVTDIGVVATASNKDGLEPWFRALEIAKAKILRGYKKYERPYFSVLSKAGSITTEHLLNRTTRRSRPRERETVAQSASRELPAP